MGSGGSSAAGGGGAAAAAGSLFGVDPEAGVSGGEDDTALLEEGPGFSGAASRPLEDGADPFSPALGRDVAPAGHAGARPASRPSGCLSVQDYFPTKTFVAGRWFDDQVRAIQGRAEGARWIGILGKGLPDYLRALGWREVDHPAEASLLVTRVFYQSSVPWNTVAQGYKPLAVSTFPKRSPYSLFSGCRMGVKESIYACLMVRCRSSPPCCGPATDPPSPPPAPGPARHSPQGPRPGLVLALLRLHAARDAGGGKRAGATIHGVPPVRSRYGARRGPPASDTHSLTHSRLWLRVCTCAQQVLVGG